MKRTTNDPYGFNIKYEFKTYKYVGEDYDLNQWSRIRRYIRSIWNRNESKYKKCDRYSDWDNYVRSNLPMELLNYQDFMHWACMKQRNSQKLLEGAKCVIIPIYIAIISIFQSFIPSDSPIPLVIFSLSIACVSIGILVAARNRVNFWTDYIEIIKAKYDNKQKI